MVTQKIVTRLSNDVLPPVRMVSGDVGREIQLEIYANDESLAPIDLETYSARITIIKPDKTFVIQDFDNDKVELPEQAGAVTGHGYYQIKIYTAGDHQIYTGQGPFIVDDDVLSDEMIESVAEVNGYEFPDDFLTDADLREYVTKYELEDALAGIIDDNTTDYNSTWSSAKISESLSSVTKTATGNPIEITDGADASLVKCVTQITGYQSGSGTPSPDNIRPITAYTEGEIEVSDEFITPSLESGTLSNDASKLWSTSRLRTIEFYSVKANSNYTIEFSTTKDKTVQASYQFWRLNTFGDNTKLYDSGWNESYPVITSPTEDCYMTYVLRYSDNTDIATSEVTSAIKGNTTTHTTTFPTSVYRGEVDFVGGSEKHDMIAVDLGNLTWRMSESTQGGFISDLTNYKFANNIQAVCSAYNYVGTNQTGTSVLNNGEIGFYYQSGAEIILRQLYIRDTRFSTLSDFESAISGVQFAYELATPTTTPITISNAPVKSLNGYNHIESSTGDMEVEYITQTYDAIMEATKLDNMKVYSTAEQVVGKWIDGRDVYERTIVSEFTNHAENYTLDLSQMGGNAILPIDISPAVCIFTEGGGTYKQIVQPTATNQNINSISVYHGGSTADTFKGYVTVRYIYL